MKEDTLLMYNLKVVLLRSRVKFKRVYLMVEWLREGDSSPNHPLFV